MQRVNKWQRTPVSDRRKRVAELHAKGLTNAVIAKRLSIADTTVSQDLLALGLRKPKRSLADIYATQAGVDVAELLTAHRLAKLDRLSLQALFLDGMTPHERGSMTGKTLSFTLAELSTDALIAAVLRQHETPAPAYPRVPEAGGAPTMTPHGGGAPAGAGDATVAVARPEHARRAS